MRHAIHLILALAIALAASGPALAAGCERQADGRCKETIDTADLMDDLDRILRQGGDSSTALHYLTEEQRVALCDAWNRGQDWNLFKSVLDSTGFPLKQVIPELRCSVGTISNVPLFHIPAYQPTSYRVIYRRAMRQLHHENANHMVTCAVQYLRLRNNDLFQELRERESGMREYVATQTDPVLIEAAKQSLIDLERMRKVLQDHVAAFPVSDISACGPDW